ALVRELACQSRESRLTHRGLGVAPCAFTYRSVYRLDTDAVDQHADDVGCDLLSVASARCSLPARPGIDEVEQHLGRERRVHLAELAGPHAFVEDLLDGREEVAEKGAARLARLIHGQSNGPVAQQPRS